MGRNAMGIEILPENYELAKKMLPQNNTPFLKKKSAYETHHTA